MQAVATAVAEGVGGIVGNCIPHGCNFQFSDTFMLKDVEEAIVSAAASALADGCTGAATLCTLDIYVDGWGVCGACMCWL